MKKVTIRAEQKITYARDVEMSDEDWAKYEELCLQFHGWKLDEALAKLIEKHNIVRPEYVEGSSDLDEIVVEPVEEEEEEDDEVLPGDEDLDDEDEAEGEDE